jgi:AraC-like DNA-binding protein
MPYKLDVFAIFIFLGVVQAFFLCFFFLSYPNRTRRFNVLFGVLLISMGATILEIFLMYTGYIVHCLYLVDFSEPFAFVIGPAFYLMIVTSTRQTFNWKYYLHFLFAIIYLFLLIPFFLSPESVKYNSWIASYNLDLPFRDLNGRDPRVFWLTDYHTELALIWLGVYGLLAIAEIARAFRQKKESFFNTKNATLKILRDGTIQVASTTAMILVIKLLNPQDTGDHYFAAYISLCIYLTSFAVIRQSGFFNQATITEPARYKTSALPVEEQQRLLAQLQKFMVESKPFLRSDCSLPDLAEKIGSTVHSLSQAINVGLGKSFFEMLAEYRVEEAKKLLITHRNIKVEEIADQVGYNSKSSFNTAFKKLTGKTPSEFRASS